MAPSEHVRIEQDLAEVRAELAAVRAHAARAQGEAERARAELDQMRAELVSPVHGERRRRRRSLARRDHISPDGQSSRLLSRRHLFGLVGGAAAAGAGLAVVGSTLGAEPAAASTDMVYGGGPGSNDAGSANTDLTSTNTSTGGTLSIENTNQGYALVASSTLSGIGVVGLSADGQAVSASASGSGNAVYASPTSGNGVAITAPGASSSGAHLYLSPGSVPGPPVSGAPSHLAGQLWMDSDGALWQCTIAGSPGNWVNLSSPLVQVNPPARVYDSRTTDGPLGFNGTRNVTVTGSFGDSPDIPADISAVLCNLTAAEPSGAGFLAMFSASSSWSGTSNLNFNPGQDISNNVTSAVSFGTFGQVRVYNGGAATNFVVDVFGYYA